MICSPPTSPLRTSMKWEGVSFISSVQYDEECLRVWKDEKVGPGKLVPYCKFHCPCELPSLSNSSDFSVKMNFGPIKLRRIRNPLRILKTIRMMARMVMIMTSTMTVIVMMMTTTTMAKVHGTTQTSQRMFCLVALKRDVLNLTKDIRLF